MRDPKGVNLLSPTRWRWAIAAPFALVPLVSAHQSGTVDRGIVVEAWRQFGRKLPAAGDSIVGPQINGNSEVRVRLQIAEEAYVEYGQSGATAQGNLLVSPVLQH